MHDSVRELESATRECITVRNEQPKPFVWPKSAEAILNSIGRFASRTRALHSTNNMQEINNSGDSSGYFEDAERLEWLLSDMRPEVIRWRSQLAIGRLILRHGGELASIFKERVCSCVARVSGRIKWRKS